MFIAQKWMRSQMVKITILLLLAFPEKKLLRDGQVITTSLLRVRERNTLDYHSELSSAVRLLK